jgi:hypothetical protein
VTDSAATISIGVRDYGGEEQSVNLNSTDYAQTVVTFTTGASSALATVFCAKFGEAGEAFCDDFELAALPVP